MPGAVGSCCTDAVGWPWTGAAGKLGLGALLATLEQASNVGAKFRRAGGSCTCGNFETAGAVVACWTTAAVPALIMGFHTLSMLALFVKFHCPGFEAAPTPLPRDACG